MKRLFPSILTVLLGLAFVFPTTPSWSAGTLKVTTPNGGQNWETGKKYAIKWVKGNAGRTVKIQLLKSGKHHKWIAKKTKNDGKYTWKIPTTVDSGSAYKVKIVSIKNKRVFDKSNKNFTITQTDSGEGAKHSSSSLAKNAAKSACTKIKPISLGSKVTVNWTATSCSGNPIGGAARAYGSRANFYVFTLPSRKKVTIEVSTKAGCGWMDEILVLRKGEKISGSYIAYNDNGGSGLNPKLVKTLSPGIYTIEAASPKRPNRNNGLGCAYLKISGGVPSSDSLTVTTPNGGQKWKTGKSYALKWTASTDGAKVKIQLLKSGKHSLWISKWGTKNDGKHPWKIPSTVATGSDYKIKITSTSKKTVTDTSNNNFTITKVAVAPSITVITPNGGQKWETGKSYRISWTHQGIGPLVRIQLLNAGWHQTWVSGEVWPFKTKNDGEFVWEVPAWIGLWEGNDYKIRIMDGSGPSNEEPDTDDTSDKNFTITKGDDSKLTVTTPNGGQKWKTGKKYTIKWAKGNAGTKVKIQLLKSGKHNYWISKSTNNDGKHPWTIPATIKTGAAYKIKITSISDKTINDTSNKNFTITKAGSSDDDTGGTR